MTEFDKVILPGREGKVTASINTDHLKGPVTKSVTVTTNDPAKSRFTLEVKANISVPIDVQPSDSVNLTAKIGEEKSQELTIVANDSKPFDIVSVKDVPGIKWKIDPILDAGAKPAKAVSTGTVKPVASGSMKYKLTVTSAPDAAVGRTFQTLEVGTSHPKVPSLQIRCSLMVQGEVEVVPERVYLQSLPPMPAADGTTPPAPATPPAMSQTVKLRKTTGSALKIEGVTSSDPDFATTVKTIQDGKEYDVEIKYTGKPGRGMVSAQVTVKTNEAKQQQIVIPVAART